MERFYERKITSWLSEKIVNLLDYLRTRRKRVAEVYMQIEMRSQYRLQESMDQQSHSPKLCQRTAREQ